MKNLRIFGTGATIITFLVMAVSGVALFLGLRGGNLKLIHEYVGVAMVVAALVHIIVNFKACKNYFSGLKGVVISLLSAGLITASFIGLSSAYKKCPPKVAYAAILNMDLNVAKTAFKTNESKFNEFLQKANLQEANQNMTIDEFAKANNIDANDLICIILPPMKKK